MRTGTIATVLALLSALSFADSTDAPALKTVVPGPEYHAGLLHRLLFGSHYRDLWAAPVEVPVLDLDHFGGGLTVLKRGGGEQTKSLRFQGADQHQYAFRSVDKDPQGLLPERLRMTWVRPLLQDQISMQHPLAALLADSLQAAAHVPHASPRLVLMPNDPRLGDEYKDFAGMLGTIEERPISGSDEEPGFADALEVAGSEKLYKKLTHDFHERADAGAYLHARLFDVWIGDWDRHKDQFRWARFADAPSLWRPIARDRDQAFDRIDGLLWMFASVSLPHVVGFGDDYPAIWRLTYSGRQLDRELLSGLEWPAWRAEAEALQALLTDSAIDSAVRLLPTSGPYGRNAAALVRALKHRRDHLVDAARAYYAVLAGEANVYTTDKREVAEAAFRPDGTLEVRVRGHKEDQPYFQRVFRPSETREVRLYVRGTGDTVDVNGDPRRSPIRLRIVTSDGELRSGLRAHATSVAIYDEEPANARSFTSGPGPRDWGSRFLAWFRLGFNSDQGFLLGGVLQDDRYAFRQFPYRQRHQLSADLATVGGYRSAYVGEFHSEAHRPYLRLGASASDIDFLHFYGLGNETAGGDRRFHEARERNVRLEPTLVFPFGGSFEATVGPRLVLSTSSGRVGTFVQETQPFGLGRENRVAFATDLRYDTRRTAKTTMSAALLAAGGSFTPAVLDARDSFGDVHGEAGAHVGVRRVTLAARAGARKVFGDFPFTEAAFLGGAETLRGYAAQRFAGDAALWSSAELRVSFGEMSIILPGQGGVFGLADVGRVYLAREDSRQWHKSYGGGIWYAFVDRANTVTFAVAHSDEGTRFVARAGFGF
jgi:hypothetical protein